MNEIYKIKKGNEKNKPNRNIMVSTFPLYMDYLHKLVDKYETNRTLRNLCGYLEGIDVEKTNDKVVFKAYHLLKFTLVLYATENVGGFDEHLIKERIDEFIVKFLNDLCFHNNRLPNLYISTVKGEHDDTDMSFNIVGLYDDKNIVYTEDLGKLPTRSAFIKVIYNNKPVTCPFDALEQIGEGNCCCVVVKDSFFCTTNYNKSNFIQVFDFADMINAMLIKNIFDSSFDFAVDVVEDYLILPPADNELFA